jgi:hypothetical protein
MGGQNPIEIAAARDNPLQLMTMKLMVKEWEGNRQPFFLLAEAARSECALAMRAVKDGLPAPSG